MMGGRALTGPGAPVCIGAGVLGDPRRLAAAFVGVAALRLMEVPFVSCAHGRRE
jgi:hypothetical protein